MKRSARRGCIRLTGWLRVTLLVALLISGGLRSASGQEASAPPTAGALSFRDLLLEAGLTVQEISALAEVRRQITPAEADAMARILYRLEQRDRGVLRLEPTNLPPASAADQQGDQPIGELVQWSGRATRWAPIELPIDSGDRSPLSRLFRVEATVAAGQQVVVLTPEAPRAWLQPAEGGQLDEPVAGEGVLVGRGREAGVARAVVLSRRLRWHPASGVPAGTAWLARRGFDAAQLDDVKQGRSFAKPDESRETAAFYQALALLSRGDSQELTLLARQAAVEAVAAWSARAAAIPQRQAKLAAQLTEAAPKARPALEQQLLGLQREAAVAQRVAERADQGLSSSWPMFLVAEESVGELFLIEGTARRAVRVILEEPVDGLTHYFEVDLFPTDSENQPIICCVARLPAGFPTGDMIREPVRVAGIFFKRWAYARRPDLDRRETAAGAARVAPPLILAAEPQWLPPPPLGERSGRGLAAGIAILVATIVISLLLVRIARRDRLARSRRARYDAPLDEWAES